MKLRWLISSIVVPILCGITFLGLAHRDALGAETSGSDKIEGLLVEKIASDGSADFLIRFTDQADLSPAYSMDWESRGEFVYHTLLETANSSQANAKALLDQDGVKYQTFINGNELYVWAGTLTNAGTLAALPEVSFISATRTYTIDPYINTSALTGITWAGDFLSRNALTTVGASPQATIDWGITDTKANQFWSTFGVKGAGIVVANIDSGVQWDHPALDQSFKCRANPSDQACWYEPITLGGTSICGGTPCDNNGHGTHTMGTMVGNDDPSLTYIAGMAPDAQWIACKGCETSQCSSFALNACADWILAPGGSAANRPNVVNNSWGGSGGNDWYQTKVQNWVAAGIFPAFSAGNDYTCNSLSSPGDYQVSFSSASHMSNRSISDFSSKGPSAFGHDPYTKPNISAPGSNICSSIPGNGWSCNYSGTSMASPHTAGAVALLWSCNPSLKGQIDATFQVLQNNTDAAPAGSCGAPPDGEGNYTYGYGYLDVLAAGITTCSGPKGTINGHVYDSDGIPIVGAAVTIAQGINANQPEMFTDPTGYYSLNLLVGNYAVTAQKAGYSSQSKSGVVVTEGGTTTVNFTLDVASQLYLPLVSRYNPIINGDFEQGPIAWTEHSNYGYELILQAADLLVPPYDGSWAVWLGGDYDEVSYIQQQVVVPSTNPYLSYWYWIASQELICSDYFDVGGLLINGVMVDSYLLCNANDTNGWVKRVVNLSAFAGQAVYIQIRAECDNYLNSNLFIDHVSFQSTSTSTNLPPAPITMIDASISKSEALDK